MKLIGLAELAELYGVSKNTASTWSRQRDWPAPIAILKMGPIWDQEQVEAHKTPARKQQFSIRCSNCYSDAVHSPGVNLDCSFTVQCGSCGERSRFAIKEVPGGSTSGWATVTISVSKEDE